jgi:hypothetical protein
MGEDMSRRPLGIYLNDHLAGSTTGVELAKRLAGENRGMDYGPDLERLAAEIADDREELKRIMRALGVRANPLKPPLAWGVEKVGRAKLNDRLTGYSPLSRLTEVEALTAGVTGKRCLWRCLHELAPAEPRLDAGRLLALAAKAEQQLRTLDRLRVRAAGEALD